MGKKAAAHEKKGHQKKNTSLRLEGKMLKALKILAIHEDTSVQAIIEHLVAGYLAQRGITLPVEEED